MILLVNVNIIAIYGLRKSSEVVYYQITQLSEQKYRLAVHLAEHNFGPFERIFFIIVLFESLSKHYLECYFRVCIFKFASLLPYFHFWSDCEIIPTGNTISKCQNNATFVSYDSGNARNRFYRSNRRSAPIRVILTSSRLQEFLIGPI
jgi:hypothetical protein